MSNFMHKFKDAMTDHDDRDTNTYSNNPTTQNQSQAPKHYNTSGMDTRGTGPTNTNTMGNSGPGYVADNYGSNTMRGSGNTNAGPHESKTANKMDPRVDSDQDHRDNYSDPRYGADSYGSNTMHGDSGNTNINAGPHESKTANKMDPRVDSDQDNRANLNRNTNTNTNPFQSQSQANQGVQGLGSQGMGSQGMGSQASQGSQAAPSFASNTSNTGSMNPTLADNHVSNEENYSSSQQEHKSRSTTSHATPCQDPQMGQMGQMAGNMGQGFGGGAAGGSSQGFSDANRQPLAGQGNMGKLGAGMNAQQQQGQGIGNQRGY